MKTITIGRGDNCNIIIDEPMISRSHALLKISSLGQMQIVDLSHNGTSVNGIRIKANTPYPVKRSDVVVFAKSVQLDWSLVPDTLRPFKIGAIAVAGAIIVAVAAYFAYGFFTKPSGDENLLPDSGTPTAVAKPADKKESAESDKKESSPRDAFSDAARRQKERDAAAAAARERRDKENGKGAASSDKPSGAKKDKPESKPQTPSGSGVNESDY